MARTSGPGGRGRGAANAGGTKGGRGKGGRGGGKGKGKGGKKKKQKDEMKCGESGSYGDLKKKTGKGKFDRDHVPSKAALKEFARKKLRGGRALCKKQAKAIDNIGNAIAIPKGVHSDYSPTYGSKNTPQQIKSDADGLQKAARRDTRNVKKGLKDPCKKKYAAWQKKINAMTNNDYAKMLKKAIGKPRRRRR